MSCPACFHNTTANPGMQFTCRSCGKQNLPKPRARCTIAISDDENQLTITAFGEVAAKLINLSPADLLNMATQDTTINIPTIKCGLEKETYELQIQKNTSTSTQVAPFYYNLIDYKVVTQTAPNTRDECPAKCTTTVVTTPPFPQSIATVKLPKQLTTNKHPRLSSKALIERATTVPSNLGESQYSTIYNDANINILFGTTSKDCNLTKEHIA